jgi:type IV pilus modification protein PilV
VKSEGGFTVVEVLIAVLVLTVGLLGMVTTAALTTRMIAQGQHYTEASAIANERFEILRARPCSEMSGGSEHVGRFSVSWTVTADQSGIWRRVDLAVISPTARGTRTDGFTTIIACR